MHRKWSRYLTVGCVLLISTLASAQQEPRQGTADIPFDFYVSGNKMPAGQYSLNIIAPTYVTLRSQNGKLQQDLYFFQTASPGKNPPSKIVFHLREGKYYFAEVWSWFGKAQLTTFSPDKGDQTKDVPLSPVEKDVAKPAGSL